MNAPLVRRAIDECLDDFVRDTGRSGETHPEVLVYKASAGDFQKAGFYGTQLALKELQVSEANNGLRQAFSHPLPGRFWLKKFLKWIDVINNFMGSLVSGIGLAEALKELKDCLRDQIDDH